ncbi:MAG TPA: protein kinase, partial [Terriglobales bacterium]|nr:protein kinase [Terriglobales bacterium]
MIGRTLSHYEILQSLGAGGMGEVFRARDTRLGREVAIKVLPPHRTLSPNARQRFQREAMTASALNHPNIITIHEINCVDDIDFIVMEYVRGQTLSTLMQKIRLAAPQVLRYSTQIADAVAKAHVAGIVHRDLKPGNVMITEEGLVKVLDFGVAKFADPSTNGPEDEQATQLTMPGSSTGTLLYMSPEQARGEEVDFRSDIFSFGVVLFQMFANQLPFYGANTMAVLHNLHFNPPRDLAALCPEVPKAARMLVEKMLEKEPLKRPQSMQEVAMELRGIAREQAWSLSQESAIMPTVADFVPPRLVQANWFSKIWIWAAVAVLLMAVGSALWWRHTQKPVTYSATADIPLDDNAYTLYKRGRELLDHYDRPNNLENSIKLLEKAIQIDPNSAPSYAALAEAYYRRNSDNPDPQWMKLASQYANRAVELNSDLAMSHLSSGMVAVAQGHNDVAEKQLKTAVSLDPKSALPHAWLAVLYDKSDRAKQAADELQVALKLNPNDWQTYMQVGLHAYQAGDFQKAAT